MSLVHGSEQTGFGASRQLTACESWARVAHWAACFDRGTMTVKRARRLVHGGPCCREWHHGYQAGADRDPGDAEDAESERK